MSDTDLDLGDLLERRRVADRERARRRRKAEAESRGSKIRPPCQVDDPSPRREKARRYQQSRYFKATFVKASADLHPYARALASAVLETSLDDARDVSRRRSSTRAVFLRACSAMRNAGAGDQKMLIAIGRKLPGFAMEKSIGERTDLIPRSSDEASNLTWAIALGFLIHVTDGQRRSARLSFALVKESYCRAEVIRATLRVLHSMGYDPGQATAALHPGMTRSNPIVARQPKGRRSAVPRHES